MTKNDGQVTIENAELKFLNFTGAKGMYNAEGDRNFQVNLPSDVAELMKADGYNVKVRKLREGDDPDMPPQHYIQVKVKFGKFPPQITTIGSITGNRRNLTEETVPTLDDMEIVTCDVVLRPYKWDVNGETGISCYLKKMFVKIHEDHLDLKWAAVATDNAGTDDSAPWEE